MAAASAAIRVVKNEIRQRMKNTLRAMSAEERRWQSDILASMVCYQVHLGRFVQHSMIVSCFAFACSLFPRRSTRGASG